MTAIKGLKLRYLKDSKKIMGVAMWDVLAPKVPGYTYSELSGVPTFGLDGLKENGLLIEKSTTIQ